MTIAKTAEIAGAGLAGLITAVALAKRGWKVRVHDRYPSLRVEGFGISLFENSLRTLEAVGVYEQAVREANWMRFSEYRIEGVASEKRAINRPAFRVSRRLLTGALADEAVRSGVEIVYDSTIVGADPAGALIDKDGRRFEAELIVGADGLNSAVRKTLDIATHRSDFEEGAMRFIVRREPEDMSDADAGTAVEWWSGNRRVIFSPCSLTEHYLALTCLADDVTGRQVPIDVASWSKAFPEIAYVFERARDEVDWSRIMWSNFAAVKPAQWSRGRVALVGDAAHAMPPNLGQGGGTALMNGLSLAVSVSARGPIDALLRDWERRERPLTNHTQRFSVIYLRIARLPAKLQAAIFWLFTNFGPVRNQLFRTANHWPVGAVDRVEAKPLPIPVIARQAAGLD
jgi:2-polyprenyl-6-methoxyphenol hydroxylase-like FAD-dependent oxidoreductase